MNGRAINKILMAGMLAGSLLLFTGCGAQAGTKVQSEAEPGGTQSAENTASSDQEQMTDGSASSDGEQDLAGTTDGGSGGPGEKPEAEAAGQPGEAQEPEADPQTGEMQGTDAAQGDASAAFRDKAEEEGVQSAKKLSILGDSISTFDGWIPAGYSCFFPMNGTVSEIGQTWWKQLLDNTGMELCVNGSSSGCTCTGDSLSMEDYQSGCSNLRIGDLRNSDGGYPDVIVVYMGTNDFLRGVPLGDNDGTRAVEEGVIGNFSDAYCLILDKLKAAYPDAEIICCTLTPIGDWGTDTPFVTFVNGEGLTSGDYSRRIEIIAAAKGCRLIDFANCGITIENMDQYVADGVHMNPEGMKLLYEAALRTFSKKE